MRRTSVWVGTVAALGLVGLAPGHARAWGLRGHQVVALIAYYDLAGDPAVQARIHEVLKAHPDADTYFATPAKLDGMTADEWRVARAAYWPDAVRKTAADRPTWHYVNHPLLLNPTPTLRAAVDREYSDRKANHGDLLVAFPDSRRIVRDPAGDAKERAVRLCWVFHLAGDIHQPLHATALCTPELPAGDRGGNAILVRRLPTLPPVNLHAYWDNLPELEGTDPVKIARTIRMETDFTAEERRVRDVGAWAEESYEHAAASVYRYNGQPIRFALAPDPANPPADVPVVTADPEGYEQAARRVARRRLLLAGLRLADALRADLAGPP